MKVFWDMTCGQRHNRDTRERFLNLRLEQKEALR
jgi:hypothetical protein